MFLSIFHIHKKKYWAVTSEKYQTNQSLKNLQMDTGEKAKLEIQSYYSMDFLNSYFLQTNPHAPKKDSTFTKAKHFYMLMLNQYSRLDSHASHHELCCKVGNKTHLPPTGTHNFQTTHIFASSTSTTVPSRLIATLLYLSTENPEMKSPKLKSVKDSRAVSNLKIPRQFLPLILMGSPWTLSGSGN